MFKAIGRMVEKNIEKKEKKLEEQAEHLELVAYLKGHGHDRVHSQILLGMPSCYCSSWTSSDEQVQELFRRG